MRTIYAALAIIPLVIGHAQCLTDTEVDSVLFMKQEEKLAHDVYTLLYEKWGQPIFSNIAQSESQHVAAVDSLITKFELTDTALEAPGTFSIPALQTLYDDLIEKGKLSLINALLVGILIEETDIADLTRAIDSSSDASVIEVFTNLRRGSENHLRAFTSKLARLYTQLTQPELSIQFDSLGYPILQWSSDWDHETRVRIERKVGQSSWQTLETLPANRTDYTDSTCGVAVTAYRVVVASDYEEVSSESVTCLRPIASFDHWSIEVFGVALDTRGTRLADPDRDGIRNVEEYARGSDPLVPNKNTVKLQVVDGGQLSLARLSRANLDDTRARIQTSVNLWTWNEADIIIEITSSPGPGLEKVTTFIPKTPAASTFLRLATF